MQSESFAAWRQPHGEWHICYGPVLSAGSLHDGDVCITPWLTAIGEDCDNAHYGAVEQCSTPKDEYLNIIATVAARAAARAGKTVIARCICGQFKSLHIREMVDRYFRQFEDMFCYIFYHPSTGWWMGATPELVAVAGEDGKTYTRALAGTRAAGSTEPWDFKNLEEHRLVVEDICARAAAAAPGVKVSTSPCHPLKYRSIEHLCTPITVQGADAKTIAGVIYPTPAVAGYPLSDALADIKTFEPMPRRFYAGLFSTPGCVYAMLRCVNFDSRRWCVYTGSGITPLSNPDEEWAETEAKARPLLNLLMQY